MKYVKTSISKGISDSSHIIDALVEEKDAMMEEMRKSKSSNDEKGSVRSVAFTHNQSRREHLYCGQAVLLRHVEGTRRRIE